MRKELQKDVIKAHLDKFSQLPAVTAAMEAAPGANPNEVASNIMNILGDAQLIDDDFEAPGSFHPAVKQWLGNQEFVLQFMSHHVQRMKTPVMLQPNVMTMVTAITGELAALKEEHGQGTHGRVQLDVFLDLIKPFVYDVFDEEWACFGANLIKVLSESDRSALENTPSSVSAGLFDKWCEIDLCFKRRAQLVVAMCERMTVGDARITVQDCSLQVAELSKAMDHLANVDLKIRKSAFLVFWGRLLTTEPAAINSSLQATSRSTSTPDKNQNEGDSLDSLGCISELQNGWTV